MNPPENPTPRKKIFILDDHPVTRYGLSQLLKQEPDLEVCGEASNANDALNAIKQLQPDLVLADIALPGKSGLEFIKDASVLHPNVAVLAISMCDEDLYALRVLKAGGRGYLMKHAGGEKLVAAIRRVLAGHLYVSEAMNEKMLGGLAGRYQHANDSALNLLTDREFEVFKLIGQGLTTHELGAQLHMSVKTVESHRLHIRQKLKLASGAALIKFAVRWESTQPFG